MGRSFASCAPYGEPPMERFIHRQNLICLRKQLAEKDEAKRRQILRLLAEEELKDDPLTTEK
jgi:hypothetical protein